MQTDNGVKKGERRKKLLCRNLTFETQEEKKKSNFSGVCTLLLLKRMLSGLVLLFLLWWGEMLYPLDHALNVCYGWQQAKPKAGIQNSF